MFHNIAPHSEMSMVGGQEFHRNHSSPLLLTHGLPRTTINDVTQQVDIRGRNCGGGRAETAVVAG